MFNIYTLLIVAFVAFALWFLSNTREGFDNPDAQGDLVLRNLYRQIHNLEAISRNEVAQNNDHPGGNHNISKERLTMEHLAQQIAKLKSYARHEIAKRRMPVKRQDLPPLGYDFEDCYYGDCQLKMDHNERILGIPSVPGTRHSYHYRRDYETSRIPGESPHAEDMHMV